MQPNGSKAAKSLPQERNTAAREHQGDGCQAVPDAQQNRIKLITHLLQPFEQYTKVVLCLDKVG